MWQVTNTEDNIDMTEEITFEELPNGFAKGSDGNMYRRFKWDGPNYDYRTPVGHDARMPIRKALE